MAAETVCMRGHILDSLILPKVLDEIVARDGRFHVEELTVGRERNDASYARLCIEADTELLLDEILRLIQEHGAELVHQEDATLVPASADGVFPDQFYVTSNYPQQVRVAGEWIPVTPVRMDCGIAVDPEARVAYTRKFSQVKEGELVVVGHSGVRVITAPVSTGRQAAPDTFEFMASSVSSEKPKTAVIRAVAEQMKAVRAAGQKLVVVGGPAIVHTGAGPHLVRLIEQGYVQLLLAGNALAVHDIEDALYGTALGVHLEQGTPVARGHQHHIHAINTIRRAGSIRAAVEQGILTRGVMHACVTHGVDYLLAGSIRDDGPLPDVVTDAVQAQLRMGEMVQGAGMALMIATMLHSVAVGNLLPASCKIVCVDINPAVVTKLADRGSHQSIGLVTDVEPFFHELLGHLE